MRTSDDKLRNIEKKIFLRKPNGDIHVVVVQLRRVIYVRTYFFFFDSMDVHDGLI